MNHNLIYMFTFIVFILGLVVSIYSYIHKKKIHGELHKNKLEEDEVKKAEKLLQIHGYKVNPKKKFSYFFSLNGKYAEVILKPDFSATKTWKRFAVVINKTGKGIAENSVLRKSATEFYYAGHFDGILIVDLEKQDIDKVVYINRREEFNSNLYRMLLIIIFILSSTTIFFFMNFIGSKT